MQIFAKKHFTKNKSFTFKWILYLAIWLRASLAMGKRALSLLLLPWLDALFIYGGMLLLALYWQAQILNHKYDNPPDYYFKFPTYYFYFVIPCYILIWLVGVSFNKGYAKPYSSFKTNKGIIMGTIAILLVYALLPETLRFSRAVTVFGAVWTAISMNTLRYLLSLLKLKGYQYDNSKKRRILIIGTQQEAERVAMIAQTGSQRPELISATEEISLDEVKNYIKEKKINELIFCSKDIVIKNIITYLIELKSLSVLMKIAPENEQTIIGSRNIQSPTPVKSYP
jgi:FlaA1/EpsC-like NDP-sugar epimerase